MSKFKLSKAGNIWAGTLQALNAFLEGEDQIPAIVEKGPSAVMDKRPSAFGLSLMDSDDHLPELLQIMGDTAIVNISGVLVQNRTWYDSYVGRVSYPAIREAVMYAVTNQDVKRILMMINSNGGHVWGATDLAAFLGKVGKIKPLLAHNNGVMASAAYWIGSQASYITSSDVASTGSIGAVVVHQEYTKAMEDEGVAVTVVRSGPYKYLGNHYEKLSETALAEMQGEVDAVDRIFVEQVAAQRGRSVDYVRNHMGLGRSFIGATAKDLGLVDEIYTYDDMISKVMAGDFDQKATTNQNLYLGGSAMGANKQDPAVIQALAEQGIHTPVEGTADVTAQAEPAAKEGEAEKPAITAEDGTGVAGENDADITTDDTTDVPETGAVTALMAKIEAKDTQILDLRFEAKVKDDRISNLEASVEPLKQIVAAVTSRMGVALGHAKTDYSAMSVADLLTQHEAHSTNFASKFSAGGVSSATASPSNQNKAPKRSAQEEAALRAVRLKQD